MQGEWLQQPRGTTSVAFVHGILSSGETGWQHENGSYWPRLLMETDGFDDVGVYVYTYQTGIFSGSYSLDDVVDDLKERIRVDRLLAGERLVFVCHSMGGIVVRKYVVERAADLVEKNIHLGLFLVASPSLGSNYGTMLEPIARFMGQLQAQALSFSQTNTWLNSLDKQFINLRDSGRLRITAKELIEDKSIVLKKFLRRQIVEPFSGSRYFGEAYKVPLSDHFSIAKPGSPKAIQHLLLCEFIDDMRAVPPTPRTAQPPDANSFNTTALPPGVLPQGQNTAFQAPLVTQLVVTLAGPTSAQFIQNTEPRPQFEELFDVISDPAKVPEAFFGTGTTATLLPYAVDYVNGRDGVGDVQEALRDALNRSGGRLLVAGRAGIGKTREVTELARSKCLRKWKICLARIGAGQDARLAADVEIPLELTDSRVLVVIDNLHARVLGTASNPVPYTKRLQALLAKLERLKPGDVSAIAISRDEPRFERQLKLRSIEPCWNGFECYYMPEFTLDGLRQILLKTAQRARVVLAEEDAAALVENSDRKPETLFINVSLALANHSALTKDTWMPTEGESWREKIQGANARYPLAARVLEALRLLTDAQLPARREYVTALSDLLSRGDSASAIDGLLDEGLLNLRQNLLTAFSAEQLEEGGQRSVCLAPAEDVEAHLDDIAKIVAERTRNRAEWAEDLGALASSFLRVNRLDDVLRITGLALERGFRTVWIHLLRSGAKFLVGDMQAAERELDAAILLDPKEGVAYQLRGTVRLLSGRAELAMEDNRQAIELGRDDQDIHSQLAMSNYQLGKWEAAAASFSIALEKGPPNAMLYFTRANALVQLGDFAGADADFTAVLEHGGFDLQPLLGMLSWFKEGLTPCAIRDLEAALANPIGRDNAVIFGLRGVARMQCARFEEAEADFTAAIEDGFAAHFAKLSNFVTNTKSLQHLLDPQRMAQVQLLTDSDGLIYQLRGQARAEQGNYTVALDDYREAMERGVPEAEIRGLRGFALGQTGCWLEAEQELARAIELDDSSVASWSFRGNVYLAQNKAPAAEADFERAMKLGRDDSWIYAARAKARAQQAKFADAEADLSIAIGKSSAAVAAHLMRAAVRLELGKFVEAEQDCGTVLATGGDAAEGHAHAHAVRGAARIELGNIAAADEDIAAAMKLGEDGALVYRWRGFVRMHQNRLDEADEDFTTAIDRGDNHGAVFFGRGIARSLAQRSKEALADFDAAAGRGVDPPALYNSRGRAHFNLGQHAEAEADFTGAIESGVDDDDIYLLRGHSRASQQKYVTAIEDFTTSMKRSGNQQVRVLRARTLRDSGQLAASEQDLDELIALDGNNAEALIERGRTRLCRARFTQAEQDFAAALTCLGDAAPPMRAQILAQSAVALYAQGEYAGALPVLAAALEHSPRDDDILSYRANVLLALGREAEAAADIALLAKISPESASAALTSGKLLLLRKDFAGALARFSDARRISAEAEGRSFCGLANLLLGNLTQAQADYQPAELDDPGGIRVALMEMDWWLNRFAARVASTETQAAVREIRQQLLCRLQEHETAEVSGP